MEAFVGPKPGGCQVNHKDGNKANDALANLEYVTVSENIRHAFRTGLLVRARGEASPVAKLTDAMANEIRARYRRYDRAASQYVLAREYGVNQGAISAIVRGETYPGLRS